MTRSASLQTGDVPPIDRSVAARVSGERCPSSRAPWPARELDGTWDVGLQRWRYRQLLAAIAGAAPPLHDGPHGDSQPRLATIRVPVPTDWRPRSRLIRAYDCDGLLLDERAAEDGTVLAQFPSDQLARAITARLDRLGAVRRMVRRTRSPEPRRAPAQSGKADRAHRNLADFPYYRVAAA